MKGNKMPQSCKLALFGGPAGSGKSTLAKAWSARRERAAHIQLDEIRSLIVVGLADPQKPGDLQAKQFLLSVGASCALAREFINAGYDVAIDDVLSPGRTFDSSWRRYLRGIDWKVVIIHPTLQETLTRSSNRDKRVPDHLVRQHHGATLGWPDRYRVDTTGLTVDGSLALIEEVLQLAPPQRGTWKV